MKIDWEFFRKFGLDHCDLPTMLWNVSIVLRMLTLNIDSKYTKRIPIIHYVVMYLSTACYVYAYVFSVLWFVFWRCPQTGDVVAAMVVLSLGTAGQIGTLKLCYMFVHIVRIRKLTDDYMECDSRIVPGSRFHANLLKTLKLVKKRASMYWMALSLNGVLYVVVPALIPGKHLPEDYFVVYGFEPSFESPNFEVTYILMTGGCYFICYIPTCVTAYLIVIAGYTEAQMLALSEETLHIWSDAVEESNKRPESNKNESLNKIISKRLKEIIRQHTVILNLYLQLEDVFRGAIAMGFLVLIFALTIELLGGVENTGLQMPFAYVQLAMDCFIGQRVMDASVVFERAVYECKWENFNASNMKMVLVLLHNAQKTMTMSAGGIATLSFSCLMSITRRVYSAYMALRSTVQ